MEKIIYIGTIEDEPYGIPLDYEYNNLFKMNQFLGFLIQNQDFIYEIIESKFSRNKADLFSQIISEYDEFEVIFFHNLDTTQFESDELNDLVFKIDKKCIVLSMDNKYLVFNLPLDDLLHSQFTFDGEDLDFQKIKSYQNKCICLSNDDDFPHLFMSESQISDNLIYLSEALNQILSIVGLDSKVSLSKLNKMFGEANTNYRE
jgi:hypothetical protein